MNKLLTWFASSRFRMSLSHIPEGLMIQVVLMVFHIGSIWAINGGIKRGDFAFAAWLAATEVNAWYWSRKKLEMEIEAQKPGQSHAYLWAVGWWPGQWDVYKRWDWILPTVATLLVAFLYQAIGI